MFQAWENLPSSWNPLQNYLNAQRAKIAAGEKLFNTRALTISSVRGLNDNAALGAVPVAPFMGTCTTCHDAPNAGDHSLPLPLDIGTSIRPRMKPTRSSRPGSPNSIYPIFRCTQSPAARIRSRHLQEMLASQERQRNLM